MKIDEPEAEIDVVVVGGGACGLAASLAARDAGAEVLVLERHGQCAGSSAMSLGALCAAGSREQAVHGVEDDADSFLADIMRKTGNLADPTLAAAVARESGPTLDWLAASHAVPFELDLDWRPAFGHRRRRMHAVPERSGTAMMARLQQAAEDAEVLVLTNAEVTDVADNGHGTVQAVRYRRPDGTVASVRCRALVLASCGFGANRQMVSDYIPTMREACYFGWEHNTGDAVRWGMALGAALGDMDSYQGLGLLAEPQRIDLNPRLLIEGGVQVGSDGRRFSNELDDVSGQAARVLALPGGTAWVIYDERIHRSCLGVPQYEALLTLGARRRGDSIDEIALACGLPPGALAQTLAEIETGAPDRFGRVFDQTPLRPGYCGLKVTGALFHTQGGLVVDGNARVLRRDATPLPNLFAGGGAARGISGRGGSGYLPGAGLCTAITLGRLAGRGAAVCAGQ